MKGKFFKKATAMLSTVAMLLTYADFSAIDFSVHAENGDVPTLENFDVNGDGKKEEGELAYKLDSADDLYWFAGKVNNDNDNYGDANAFLADDITVNSGVLDENGNLNEADKNKFTEWTLIKNNYTGTFNGNNHTISGLYFNKKAPDGIGLFKNNQGTIKNVGVVDSYLCGTDSFAGAWYVAGICGLNYGTIENCYNTSVIKGDKYVGGVCGINRDSGTIKNCYNTGKVTGLKNDVGGVCGYNNCCTIINCYYLNTTTDKGIGLDDDHSADIRAMEEGQFASGEVCYLLNGGETQAETPVFYQTLGTDSLPVLDKTHKTVYLSSPCPRYLNTKDNAHSCTKVTDAGTDCSEDGFKDYWRCNDCGKCFSDAECKNVIADIDAWKKDEGKVPASHRYDENSGFCKCGAYQPAKAIADVNDIDGDENTEETVYEISNAGQLYWFADKVNGGDTSANAFLADDITVNEKLLSDLINVNDGTATVKDGKKVSEWTPIGNNTFSYSGTFNGNNHTISGLYFNNAEYYVGLFGRVENSTVKNVTVADSYFCSFKNVGGVCGYNDSSTITNCYSTGDVTATDQSANVGGICGCSCSGKIENCYNTGNVTATGTQARVGGVCGNNYSGGTIEKCYSTGDVTATGDPYYVGGVCGYNSSGTVSSCYNTGKVTATSRDACVGGVCGRNYNGTVSSCYYLENTVNDSNGGIYGEDVTGQAEKKTDGQFKSGEVCWILNGGETQSATPAFYQTLGTDESPVIDSTHETVYIKSPCRAEYSNTVGENKDHSPVSDKKDATCTEDGYSEYWHCKDCGKYFSDEACTSVITDIDAWKTDEGKIPSEGHKYDDDGVCTVCHKGDKFEKGSCGENATYKLEYETGILTISGTGAISASAFYYDYRIKEVVIGNEITEIGEYAFSGCGALESITIPDSVTYIGSSAFNNCVTLENISVPCPLKYSESLWKKGYGAEVTYRHLEAGADVCERCRYITDSCGENATYIFNTETGHLTISGTGAIRAKAFYGDDPIKEVVIGNEITEIGEHAFGDCYALESITIPDSVTSIGDYAFQSCEALESIVIPGSVTSIGDYAFQSCEALESIVIPGSVTSIGDRAFDETKWIESARENNGLVIVNGILIDGTSCSGEVVIPDTVTRINDFAFFGCEALKSVTFGENSQLESIGWDAFGFCTSLTSIVIPDSVTSIESYVFYSCTALTSITIPASVTSIGEGVFDETKWIESERAENNGLVIVNGILIDGTSCSGEVVIPDTVTRINDFAFFGCEALKSVTFGENSKLESIGWDAFGFCTSLTSIVIPDSVTSIESYVFYSCTALTSITIPDSVTSIEPYVFYSCTALTSITIPDTVTSIEFFAFDSCTALTSITIPDSVTNIGLNAFYGCSTLKNISAPCTFKNNDSIAYAVSTLGTEVTWNHLFEEAAYACKCGEIPNAKDAKLILDGVLKVKVAFNTEIKETDGWTINGKAFSTTNKTYIFETAAKDFNSDIVVMHGNDKTIFSVSELIAAYKENDKTKAIAEALEDYCTAAEDYFSENVEVADYSDKWESVINAITPFDTAYMGTNYYGSSLLLKSGIILRHYYTSEIDGYTGTKEGYYYIDEAVPANMYSSEGKYSVNDYIYKVLSSDKYDKNLKNLCVAIYNYGVAAENYDNGGNN